jgi:hypothetical protein
MIPTCHGCPAFTGEVPFDVATCDELDTDTCVEHRLKGLVRDQWIWETTPPRPCPKCTSQSETHQEHPDIRVLMAFCRNCDAPKGPVGASPIDVVRSGAGAWSVQASAIAMGHLDRCHSWQELAESIGYDFTPQCFSPEWVERLEAIKRAVTVGAGMVIVLAQVAGEWV